MKYPNKYKSAFFIFLAIAGVLLFAWLIRHNNFALLNPKGTIARQQRQMITRALLLMLIVIIPAYVLLFTFAHKYKASNNSSAKLISKRNKPWAEFSLWLLPTLIILVLATTTWKSTHALDPYRPIASSTKPLTIQVAALQWQWLFIYPEQNIATTNFLEFPANTPLNFELTADAPMNSFWIPQLGGQMYAMPGMESHLHLMSDSVGEFQGSAAEMSGRGFAGMRFVAAATSKVDFDNWVKKVKRSPQILSLSAYNKLAEPTVNNSVVSYSSVQNDLFYAIINKYMPSTHQH